MIYLLSVTLRYNRQTLDLRKLTLYHGRIFNSAFSFQPLQTFGRSITRLNASKFSLQHGILRSKLAHKSKIVGYREWSNKMSLWAVGTFPKWGTNPICYKGKSPFYRAISLGTILVGMKLPVNPATWLWAMIELRCLWTVCILGQ